MLKLQAVLYVGFMLKNSVTSTAVFITLIWNGCVEALREALFISQTYRAAQVACL